VLSASNDGSAILWDAKTGRLLRTYKGGPLSNSFLAAGELQEAKMPADFLAAARETPAVSAVEFGPDGRWFVMACRPEGFMATMNANSQAVVWDVESGKRIRVFDLAMDSGAIALSRDGRLLLSGGQPMGPDEAKEMIEMGAKVKTSTGVVLWDLTSGNEVRQFGDFDAAYDAVRFSPDGRYVLAAGRDLGELYAPPVAAGAADATLVPAPDAAPPAPGGEAKPVAKPATGEFGSGGVLHLWDATTGEQVLKLKPRGVVTKAAFSSTGEHILAIGMGDTLEVWEIKSKKQLLNVRASAAVFSADGTQVMSVDPTGKFSVWDLASGKEIRSAATSFEGVKGLALSSDGNQLLVGMTHLTPNQNATAEHPFVPGEAVLFDVASGSVLRSLAAKTDPVDCVAVGPGGRHLLVGDNLFDAIAGRKMHGFCEAQVQAISTAFAPNGKLALVANHRGTHWLGNFLGGLFSNSDSEPLATVNEIATGKTLSKFAATYPTDGRVALGFSADGTRGLTAVRGGMIGTWEVATGQKVSESQIPCNNLAAAFSPDGRLAVVSFHENKTLWWDCEKGEKVADKGRQKGQPMRPGMPAVASRDGKLQLAFSDDGSAVLVHETAKPTNVRTLKAGLTPYEALRIAGFDAQDDRFVYAEVSSPYVGIWDVEAGKALRAFSLNEPFSAEVLAFGPNGKQAATAGNDGQVTIWDVATGKKVHAIKLKSPIMTVAFSPDGNLVAAGCADRTVVVASAGLPKPVPMGAVTERALGEQVVLRGHQGPVDAVAFRPDGKMLVTACREDGTTRIWDIANTEEQKDGTVQLRDGPAARELVRILSIQNGRDWLAFTPNGAYDGSKGGLKLVAFRVGETLVVELPTASEPPQPGLLGKIWTGNSGR
jgi:WD40 repeat protein